MLILYKVIFFFFFFCGLFSFVSKRKHLLSTLLSLEFMVLSMFFYMFSLLIFNFMDLYFLMYFLTFSVCEGALGLAILVSMIRSHGSDQFVNLNILQC
uniref:NADH-ubiquinone oxidoreductase chain 4L n=1 Tax=Ischnura elegans TaxID=197161 RepID=A0A1D8QQ13_ISCEL|nr:NADH dehydrogenase subunit 4L [Ischnura elegans]YP_010391238.1 NADH dehydrogenase subunit 4L [Ischnura asiatica]AOW43850.1 NADH dehydrogenase subunit 4L [Ischnura elegans]QGU85613.1 NADH dehydrogenase subunit 4L [Ischnura elegans]UPX02828.1 NADH dehydrogenase subunit 4L [Ischnura asiatica]WGM81667.1 NADH dehydrogenase subunit 4L [Ischnura elegans]